MFKRLNMIKFFRSFAFLFTGLSIYKLCLNYFGFYSLKEQVILQIAFIISFSLTLIHYTSIKLKGYSLNKKPLSLVETDITISKLEEKCLKQKEWTLKDKTDTTLVLSSRPDFLYSFGEIIEISYINSKNILIKSKPKLRTTLFDFGKNIDNVNKVRKLCLS